MKSIAFSLALSSGCAAFTPGAFSRTKSSTSLHVSVVRDLIKKSSKVPINDAEALMLEVFEMGTPESVGVKGPGMLPTTNVRSSGQSKRKSNRKKRKHNFREQSNLKSEPDLDFFTLHSSAVSHLYRSMPVNDVVRAIKRAQNLHDVHDLVTIGSFLMDHCDENWGFGYRGSLLSRLAVAALHCAETELATRAIETRRVYERPSMLPHESAAIVRGLMRVGMIEKGWEVLEDELRLPMQGLSLEAETSQELLKQRAHALSSIATRHFYEGEPYVAARALSELGTLGSLIDDSHMRKGELNMPWARLITAATVCSDMLEKNGRNVKHTAGNYNLSLPSDLIELVWDAMYRFPCPGDFEECTLEDYL